VFSRAILALTLVLVDAPDRAAEMLTESLSN